MQYTILFRFRPGINFFLDLARKFFRHLVGITIGTSCAPFSVSIFFVLFCDFFYKANYLMSYTCYMVDNSYLQKSIICQLINLTNRVLIAIMYSSIITRFSICRYVRDEIIRLIDD